MSEKKNVIPGIVDWLASEARIEDSRKVVDAALKSKKATPEDKKKLIEAKNKLNKQSREELDKRISKTIIYRRIEELKPHKDVLDVMGLVEVGDYEKMKKDIDERGIRIPLVVLNDGQIICGATRWKACKELYHKSGDVELESVPCQTADLKTKEEILEYAIKDNLKRRHMTSDVKRHFEAELIRLTGQVVAGRPQEVPDSLGKTKREKKAIEKKVGKATTVQVPERKPVRTIEANYSIVFGKDKYKTEYFGRAVASEVEKQIELLVKEGRELDVAISYTTKE